MARETFVDTNVFLYAFDDPRSGKADRALLCLDVLMRASLGVVSAQVVGEFASVVRDERVRLSWPEAESAVEGILGAFALVPLGLDVVREALRVVRTHGLDYWDAQIWAAARLGGCERILTEDAHGPRIDGVEYVDPFIAGFDPRSLLG